MAKVEIAHHEGKSSFVTLFSNVVCCRSVKMCLYVGNGSSNLIFSGILRLLRLLKEFCLFYLGFTPLSTLFQLYHGDSSLIHDPWVNKLLGSSRLENLPCPRELHHDRSAATGDRTRDTRFQIPDVNHSTSGFLKETT